MKNKYEDIQEAVLKSAFMEAAAQDIAELEAMDIEIFYPTEKQRREIERAARKAMRKVSPRFGRVWRAVAMFAVVCCLGFGLLMTQPGVRASVWDAAMSFFEKYFTFGYKDDVSNEEYAIGEYTIAYMPEGYIVTDKQENSQMVKVTFTGADDAICITFYIGVGNQISGDNETDTVKSVAIGESTGYLIQYQDSAMQKLIWGYGSHTFVIKGSISEKEMIKIAKNIR